MGYFELYLDSVLAGMAIGLGGCGYLSCENKVVGALLFSVGLLTILGLRWKLFTGMLCSKNKLGELLVCYIGNYSGTAIISVIFWFAKAFDQEKLADFANFATVKLQKPLFSTFCSAILCEFCIFVAVIGYKKVHFVLGKYFCVILGVMVFVISGFEHSIADMYYMGLSGANDLALIGRIIIFLVVVTAGNAVGAWIMRLFSEKFPQKLQSSK